MMRKNIKRKISPRKRYQLLQIYLHMGLEESRRASIAAGVGPDYAAKHASELGMSQKKIFSGGGDIAVSCDHTDPRWAWACARGAVSAP